jgi:tubulin polyglutamylase TTLL2
MDDGQQDENRSQNNNNNNKDEVLNDLSEIDQINIDSEQIMKNISPPQVITTSPEPPLLPTIELEHDISKLLETIPTSSPATLQTTLAVNKTIKAVGFSSSSSFSPVTSLPKTTANVKRPNKSTASNITADTSFSTSSSSETSTNANPPFVFKLHGGPETLRRVLLNQGWVEWSSDFHLENQYNLMWRSGHFRLSEMLSACPIQRVNHFSKSGIITNKGKLLRAHRKARSVYGKTYEFMPKSFLLPTEYTKFVKVFSEQEEKKIWICKPDNSACGRKIFLIKDLSDLKYDQQVVVQSYIDRPLTVGGYKVDLRLYVLVKSFKPLEAYLYRDGLARFGTEKYDSNINSTNLNNLYSHLTNTSINKFGKNVDVDKDVIGSGCKWDFIKLKEWAQKTEGIDWLFLWSRIRHCIIMTLLLAVPIVRQEPQCFELFGFDIIIDEKLKPWLLEVNCSPALNMDEPADRSVKPKLLRDTMIVLKHTPLTPDVLKKIHNYGSGGGVVKHGKTNNVDNNRRKRGKTTSSKRKNTQRNKKAAIMGNGIRKHSSKPTILHKNVDYSLSNIGNYEMLYPFNEETTKLANDICGVEDEIEMQQKIKSIVDNMKAFERTLLQQQRLEQRNKIDALKKKKEQRNSTTLAQDEQIKKAAQMLK